MHAVTSDYKKGQTRMECPEFFSHGKLQSSIQTAGLPTMMIMMAPTNSEAEVPTV